MSPCVCVMCCVCQVGGADRARMTLEEVVLAVSSIIVISLYVYMYI